MRDFELICEYLKSSIANGDCDGALAAVSQLCEFSQPVKIELDRELSTIIIKRQYQRDLIDAGFKPLDAVRKVREAGRLKRVADEEAAKVAEKDDQFPLLH
eukprot:Platyproteum_vivax@DN10660_c0_g1_i1.p1